MTNAQRTARRQNQSALAALSQQPVTAAQLARRFRGSVQAVQECLDRLAAAGLVHSQRQRQYPTGPLEDVWYAGGPKP